MHLDIYKGTYTHEKNWRTNWSKSGKYPIDLILKIPQGRGCGIMWKLLITVDITCAKGWIRNSTQMNWSFRESLLMVSVSTQPYVIGELFPWRYSRDICAFCLNFMRLWFLSNRFLILTMAAWTDCFVNWYKQKCQSGWPKNGWKENCKDLWLVPWFLSKWFNIPVMMTSSNGNIFRVIYWPFVRGIHRSPVNSPHKGQWREALMFSLICVWIND